MLGLAARGAAHARGANFDRGKETDRPGYAGQVYSSTPRELWPWYVPSPGIVDKSCGDAFQGMCK
jgi:hypothetical protein